MAATCRSFPRSMPAARVPPYNPLSSGACRCLSVWFPARNARVAVAASACELVLLFSITRPTSAARSGYEYTSSNSSTVNWWRLCACLLADILRISSQVFLFLLCRLQRANQWRVAYFHDEAQQHELWLAGSSKDELITSVMTPSSYSTSEGLAAECLRSLRPTRGPEGNTCQRLADTPQ